MRVDWVCNIYQMTLDTYPPPPTLRHMHTTHRNMHACTHHKHMHAHIVYSGEIKYLVRNCVDLHWQRHVCVVYSEEIAFYQGQRREQHIIIATFNKLVSGLSVSTSFSQGSFLELHTPVRCLHCGLRIVLFSLWGGDCADVFTVGWGLCWCFHCGMGIVLMFSLWGGDCADVFTVGWGLYCFHCGVGIVLI